MTFYIYLHSWAENVRPVISHAVLKYVIKSELEEVSNKSFYHQLKLWESNITPLVCPVEGDAPVSLETGNCNMSVTTLKKQTQLCMCVQTMIGIFTGYKVRNSSTKLGYSQNLVHLHSRLLCAFVTWVIEIPYMIMFLRHCIVEIPIWNRKHYFLKTGRPLNSVMFCVYSFSIRITSVFNSSTFFSAEHKKWMAVVIWWWGKYKNTL